jgi:hypothetical protein
MKRKYIPPKIEDLFAVQAGAGPSVCATGSAFSGGCPTYVCLGYGYCPSCPSYVISGGGCAAGSGVII